MGLFVGKGKQVNSVVVHLPSHCHLSTLKSLGVVGILPVNSLCSQLSDFSSDKKNLVIKLPKHCVRSSGAGQGIGVKQSKTAISITEKEAWETATWDCVIEVMIVLPGDPVAYP